MLPTVAATSHLAPSTDIQAGTRFSALTGNRVAGPRRKRLCLRKTHTVGKIQRVSSSQASATARLPGRPGSPLLNTNTTPIAVSGCRWPTVVRPAGVEQPGRAHPRPCFARGHFCLRAWAINPFVGQQESQLARYPPAVLESRRAFIFREAIKADVDNCRGASSLLISWLASIFACEPMAGLYAWAFAGLTAGRDLKVRVDGQLAFNNGNGPKTLIVLHLQESGSSSAVPALHKPAIPGKDRADIGDRTCPRQRIHCPPAACRARQADASFPWQTGRSHIRSWSSVGVEVTRKPPPR